ncbi:MAG: DUF389 domain-containing protein [Actinomycetota bacterium]
MSSLTAAGLIVATIAVALVGAAAIGRRHECSSETRIAVSRSLFPSTDERHLVRMSAFMGLSVTIAVMGISANSAAVVIGAMLLAPLTTPLMGVAVAITMGWRQRALSAIGVTLLLTALGLGIAIALAALIPQIGLTDELVSRTSPDLRDLVVALAAGGAGAYATIRSDLSATLPGVAVAVALVPPLASAGIAFHLGRYSLASGAMLLYGANLVAIVLASITVLLAVGFVPSRRLQDTSPRVAFASFSVVVGCAVVSVPLISRTVELSSDAATRRDVTAAVEDWLDEAEGLELVNLGLDGSTVELELAGETEPPRPSSLAQRLVPTLGEDARVEVAWSSRSTGAAGDEIVSTAAGFDLDEVRTVVDEWAETAGADLTALEVDGFLVSVALAGEGDPPLAVDLADQLAAELGSPAQVELAWSQRQAQRARTGDLPPAPEPGDLARAAAADWSARNGVEVVELSYSALRDPVRTTLVLRGSTAPGEGALDQLADDISAAVGQDVEVVARFAPILSLPIPEVEPDPTELTEEEVRRAVERRGVTVVSIRADSSTGVVSMVVTDEAAEAVLAAAARDVAPNWTFDIVRVAIATTTTTEVLIDDES